MRRNAIYRYKKDERKAYCLLVLVFVILSLTPMNLGNSMKGFAPVTTDQLLSIIKQNHPNPKLVSAIIKVESGWNQKAVSSKGAVGLMQVMPSTAKWLTGYSRADLFCPEKNIIAGTMILRHYQKTSPNLRVALAKYSGNANNYYRKVMEAML